MKKLWQPGQSGNPTGRPKDVVIVRDLAREQTVQAIERLIFWMMSDNPKASVQATIQLLDRAWGKPHQTVSAEVTTNDDLFNLPVRERVKLMIERRTQTGVESPAEVVPALNGN